MDDQQIGGGSGGNMGSTSADQADNTGPLEKRILSKNWSVRAGAYEELTKLCQDSQPNSKANHFNQYCAEWKTYLKDSNPGALEKALGCLEVFLDKIHPTILVPNQNDIINMLVEKCFGHAKPVIKKKAEDCLLLIFEVGENFDESIDTLNALLKHKNIKVLQSGTQAVAILVSNFGVKKVKIQDYAKQMLENAQNTNPGVKSAAYEFYTAVYKWIGDAILPQIQDKLKPAQMEELKKTFAEVKEKNDKTKRLTRTEKKEAAENAKNAAIDAAMEEEKQEVIDPLEFAEEVDILNKFDGAWQDSTAALSKWQEKKEKIDELIAACTGKKIKPGNVDSMTQFLKKEINNSNMNISMSAIKASAVLQTGMKKDFASGTKALIGVILLKFKEKRPLILAEVQLFLDGCMGATNLEAIAEEFIPMITNVAPGVKQGTVKFVETACQVTYIDVLQRIQGDLLTAMVKVMDDKDGGVRDAALHCMGILKGRLGEAVMSKYLKDVNAQKLAKIEEAAKEVKASKYDRPENWKPPPPKKAPAKKVENDDDSLMTFDDEKPVKKPPPNIGKKPPSKKKPAEDAEMVDESPPPAAPAKKEPKAPPALSSAKPKAAASAPSKGPSGPVVVEEDLGQGLSKEEAIAKVEEFFDASTVKKFEEAKWQTKLEGFSELQEQIKEKQPPAQVIEAVAVFVRAKMKDWKESNINLQKAVPTLFDTIATSCSSLNKRTFSCAMSFFVDKIGDAKLSQLIKDMLMNATEALGPKFIGLQVIKYAATAKAPNNLKESCVLLTQIIDEFGISGTPVKEMIDYATLATAHATPAVRQSAISLFCEIYKHVGDQIRNFMGDIKESTLKLINSEIDKITPYKKGEHQKKRHFGAPEAASAGPGGKAKKEEDPFGDLPREDISKKLNSKLMEQFKHKDWKIRKKGGDDVEAIIREAKMRILPDGLTTLMDALKNGMKDPNKAVVKVFIVLLGLLAEAIGPEVKQFTKKCFVPMLSNLSDKQSLVRDAVIATTNKWSEQIGANQIINQLAQQIVTENPELRTEGLKWITENKDAIKDADTKEMIKPLIACLTDKSKAIRDSTEALIMIVMPLVGYQAFMSNTKDHLPAVQQTLKPILEKIKTASGAGQNAGEATASASAAPSKPVEEEKEQAPMNSFAKKDKVPPKVEKPEQKKREVSKSPPAKPAAAAPSKSTAPAADSDEVVIKVQNKKKREQNDLKSKYPLNEVKGDHIEKLQLQCQEAFGLKFHDLMFAKAQDFKKHIDCVNQMEKFIKSQPEQLIEVNDIIFKWCNLRMMESSNTQLYISIFDFFANLITMFIETGYQVAEFEMVVLLGTLCDKTGVNNKTLQDKVRKLIRMCYEVHDKKACFRMIIDYGVKNKNLKAVAECLDELADYITINGVDHITKKDFKLFQDMADNKDKGVREASLKVFAEAYTILGEQIWTLLKDIPLKVKGLLEQRFKQVTKKTGGAALNMSINSAKGGIKGLQQNNLEMSGGAFANKRMTMAPGGLNSSLGGPRGLQFNMSAAKRDEDMNSSLPKPQSDQDKQQEEKQSLGSSITGQMERLDFKNEIPASKKPEVPEVKHEIKNETPFPKMDMMFRGNVAQPQDHFEDVDMIEDNEAIVTSAPPRRIPDQQMSQPVVTQPKQNNFVMDEDGDEFQRRLREAENNLDADPALRDQKRFILNHIQQLRDGDLLKRVDSLVALNEVISAGSGTSPQAQSQDFINQQKALIHCCNDLINAFTHVMNDIFRHPVQDIPLRFTKYFITIVHKTCTSKEIMTEVSEKSVHDLVEQLLTRLLIENLDKIGQNKEGELILKNLNSSMIRMLENCNHTYIFGVLFGLLKKFQHDDSMPKMHGLIIKCLLKLNKIMDKLIEKLDMPKFLVSIHEYLIIIDHDNRSANDDLGIRIVKTLINEIVKLQGEDIWKSYQVIENHPTPDCHIKKWISIIIKSLQLTTPIAQTRSQPAEHQPQTGSRMVVEYEFKKILQDLRDPSKYDQGIIRLEKFSKNNPNYDYKEKLDKESLEFSKQVLNSLKESQKGNSWKSTNNSDSLGGKIQDQQQPRRIGTAVSSSNLNAFGTVQQPSQELNKSLNQMSAFESKMAKFKRNSNLQQPATTSRGEQTPQQNLNTSFSAMNQNISQKWAQISNSSKKIGGLTGRATVNNSVLSQTINAAAPVNPLNTSNNKFQSRVQGSFASRLQQSRANNDPVAVAAEQPPAQQVGGGISSNSFRSRIQGLSQNQPSQISSNTQVPSSSGGAGQAAASSQDLQKRLDQMKAKMQALKKQ